jgi:hypothetical protein
MNIYLSEKDAEENILTYMQDYFFNLVHYLLIDEKES